MRRSWSTAVSALTATALAAFALPQAASAAPVSGSVFNDFNTNGVRDTAAANGAVDLGVAGQTVAAYDATGAQVATTTTADDGSYSLAAPDARVRVQLVSTGTYQPSRQLGTLRSDERFVDAGSAVAGVDFGVHRAAEYSVDDPTMFYVNQWPGPVAASRTQSAIRGISYFRTTGYGGTFATQPGTQTRATFGQIGSTFGLGQNQANGDLYAGAYYKRYSGLTPAGAGAIFKITAAGTTTAWARLQAGGDDHPTSADITDWFNGGTRDDSWPDVGSRGLGSVKIDPASRVLYAVNLFDKRLVRLPIDGAAPGTLPADTGSPIPDPGCVGGSWQPFSVGIDPATNDVYVGGVCNAAASQAPVNLRAVIYRVGDPAGTPTFTQVLGVPLTYPRVAHGTASFNANNSDWQPWPTVAALGAGVTPPSSSRGARTTPYGNVNKSSESYPTLSAISFDADGDMQLGFRDLMGDMSGQDVPGETGGSPIVQGDVLRACVNGTGWTLESGRSCGGTTGAPTDPARVGPVGPGGGYFYDPRSGYNASGAGSIGEIAQYQGGFLQVPGFSELASTYVDPGTQLFADGVMWQSNANGTIRRGLTNRAFPGGSQANANANFSKANGLGDLAAFTQQAPVQIGNRVWVDTDADGIQGAGEPVLPGVTVELLDAAGNVVDTATTDVDGEYVFAIDPDTAYSVRVPLDQPALADLIPTAPGVGSNGRIDSDGTPQGSAAIARVAGHAVGQNDHSFDFGFHQAPPPTPTPPVTPPPSTPPGAHNVSIKKAASTPRARRGSTVRYTLSVHSDGPATAPDVTVRDVAPESLRVTGVKTTRGTCVRGGNTIDCALGAMAANTDAVITVVAEVVRPGTIRNSARVASPGDATDADNSSSATLAAVAPRLTLAKRATKAAVAAGGTLSYTLVARNTGTGTATNARMCDQLPAHLSLVTTGGGTIVAGTRLCWTIVTLRPGASTSRTFKVHVDTDAPVASMVNRASVAVAGVAAANAQRTVRVNRAAVAPDRASGVTG